MSQKLRKKISNEWIYLVLLFYLIPRISVFSLLGSINAQYEAIKWIKTPIKTYIILENQIVYGYSSTIDQTDSDPFTTAYGQKVRKGIIANNCWPQGTKIRIGKRVFEVQDKMNDRYGCEVWDIWFEDRDEARVWGKKTLNIKLFYDQYTL